MFSNAVSADVRKGANREIGAPRVGANGQAGACGWHSRGYLPHFDAPGTIQHVAFHLADSLPKMMLRRLETELKSFSADKRNLERRRRVDAWIDAGHGSCILREPRIACMVQDSLLAFDSARYRLLAWVVMPNHVHVLFEPLEGRTVATIVAAWKKFTARKIRDQRRDGGESVRGPVWYREYWDRYIRDERHFWRAVEYIQMNPVKAGLVARAEMWAWSSAYAKREIRNDPTAANREIGVPRSLA